ncbi:MAG TPA: hypothetical protein VFL14_07550, partial [Xanthomonadales bacterium]|nr:hypothetical protein [Xanthomonadales bacterium]
MALFVGLLVDRQSRAAVDCRAGLSGGDAMRETGRHHAPVRFTLVVLPVGDYSARAAWLKTTDAFRAQVVLTRRDRLDGSRLVPASGWVSAGSRHAPHQGGRRRITNQAYRESVAQVQSRVRRRSSASLQCAPCGTSSR